MTSLNDIVNTAVSTGVVAYGLSTGIRSLGEQTLAEAATDTTTLYAAAISAGATAIYSGINVALGKKGS